LGIHIINGIMISDPEVGLKKRMIRLDKDIKALIGAIHTIGVKKVRLVIIDPISAYLGSIDSHKNADVRSVLAELAEAAEKTEAAWVLISHLNKSGKENRPAQDRVMGSLAFTAAVRSAYMVGKDQNDEVRRLFIPIKNNLAPEMDGLAYRIEGGAIHWYDEGVKTTADEAVKPGRSNKDQTGDSEAEDFLREYLANGPVPSRTILAEARDAGYGRRALDKAKAALHVKAYKTTTGWTWSLNGSSPSSCDWVNK
jgi:putative DNA primase/helicase